MTRSMPAKGQDAMPTSVYLARLIGPPLVLVGASMLVDPAGYGAIAAEFLKSPSLLYFGGVLGLLGGVALVLAHNVWTADWRIIITLLGWISILDSVSWILFTQQAARFWSPLLAGGGWPLLGGAIVLLLGAVLCYFGYAAARRNGD